MSKEDVLKLLNELIEQQEKTLLRLGHQLVPTLTTEDVLQPMDYPELESHPAFRYEEGVLAGLHTARQALLALEMGVEHIGRDC